jgi:hypothetical protein
MSNLLDMINSNDHVRADDIEPWPDHTGLDGLQPLYSRGKHQRTAEESPHYGGLERSGNMSVSGFESMAAVLTDDQDRGVFDERGKYSSTAYRSPVELTSTLRFGNDRILILSIGASADDKDPTDLSKLKISGAASTGWSIPHVLTSTCPKATYPTQFRPRRPENSHSIFFEMTATTVEYDDGTTAFVDTSQKTENTNLLGHLGTTGWFLVKNATSVDPNTTQGDLQANEVGISNMSREQL